MPAANSQPTTSPGAFELEQFESLLRDKPEAAISAFFVALNDLAKASRAQLELLLQAGIDALDAVDGDPDLEAACEDEGAQCDDEGAR